MRRPFTAAEEPILSVPHNLTPSHPELLAACFYRTQLQRRQLQLWKGSVSALLMFRVVLRIPNTRRLTPHQGRGLKPYIARGFLQDVNCILLLVIQSRGGSCRTKPTNGCEAQGEAAEMGPTRQRASPTRLLPTEPGGHLFRPSPPDVCPSSLNPISFQHVLQLY